MKPMKTNPPTATTAQAAAQKHRFFEIFAKPHIDFMGNRFYVYGLSAFVVGASLFSLFTKGFNYSIEFTGGTLVQVTFAKPVGLPALRAAMDKAYPGLEIQSFSGDTSFSLSAKTAASQVNTAAQKIQDAVAAAFPDNPIRVDRREFIGPVVGRFLFKQTMFAIVFSLLGIIVYVAFRFDNLVWGVAGVIALAHDVIGAMGLVSITGKEFNLLIVAALLTIAGYSISDTIVVFDRMREKMRLMRKAPLDQVINESINETLSRTIITVFTVLLVLVVLFFLGGEVIHDFSATLLFGTLIGTYSSIAVAAPLVDDWQHFKGRK